MDLELWAASSLLPTAVTVQTKGVQCPHYLCRPAVAEDRDFYQNQKVCLFDVTQDHLMIQRMHTIKIAY